MKVQMRRIMTFPPSETLDLHVENVENGGKPKTLQAMSLCFFMTTNDKREVPGKLMTFQLHPGELSVIRRTRAAQNKKMRMQNEVSSEWENSAELNIGVSGLL